MNEPTSKQSTLIGQRFWIAITAAYLLAVTVGFLYLFFSVWPYATALVGGEALTVPSAAASNAEAELATDVMIGDGESELVGGLSRARESGRTISTTRTARFPTKAQCSREASWPFGAVLPCEGETVLLLTVALTGALGALIHAWSSFVTYVGNRQYVVSWNLWYWGRPFLGSLLALVFYFVVRGGFLGASVELEDLNLHSFAALGALAGMFSKQATDKLEEVFNALFTPSPGSGDATRRDPATNGASKPE